MYYNMGNQDFIHTSSLPIHYYMFLLICSFTETLQIQTQVSQVAEFIEWIKDKPSSEIIDTFVNLKIFLELYKSLKNTCRDFKTVVQKGKWKHKD